MAQAVSRLALDVEARIPFRVSSCEICGGQSGTGTGLSHSISVIIPPMLHSHLIYTLLLPERQVGRSLGIFQKQCSFGNCGVLDRKKYFTFFHLVFQGYKSRDILLPVREGHLSNTQVTTLTVASGFPLFSSTCWQSAVIYQQLTQTECRQAQAVTVAALFKVTVRFTAVVTPERFCAAKWVSRNWNLPNAIKHSK